MYSASSKDEVVIKIIGKLSLEFPNMDQIKARGIVEEVLYKYNIEPTETALVASDIEEKLQIYLATKRYEGLSERTLKNYNYQLLIFASHLRKPLASITTMDLRMYLAARCNNLKPSSKNGQIFILKSFFSWLHAEGYIPKNPAILLKQTKEPKRLRDALNGEETEILRQACKTKREKALLEFLVSSGARLSELININISDIDWHEKSLHVIGKGNKERKIYFNIKTKILLQNYLKDRKGDDPALFTASKYPFARMGGRSIQRELKKIATRAGFEKSIFPHLMRHTFATHSINAGMDITVLQHIMGHETPQTTLIYAALNDENIKHAYKRIS